MGGGKSSSSSSSTSVTQQAEQSADGFIGSGAQIFNLSTLEGISVSTVDQFPEGVQNLVEAMIGLVGDTLTGAQSFAEGSLQAVTERVQEATQPDLTVIKYIPYMVGGIVLVAGIAIFMGRK